MAAVSSYPQQVETDEAQKAYVVMLDKLKTYFGTGHYTGHQEDCSMTELSGLKAFTALGIGEYSQFHMLAIRRRLVEIAKKRMTTVNGLIVK